MITESSAWWVDVESGRLAARASLGDNHRAGESFQFGVLVVMSFLTARRTAPALGALLALLLVVVAPHTAAAQGGARIALVIGNSGYADAPLANPANDARLMAKTLRRLGFDVIELVDADQKTMKVAIFELGDRLEAAGKDAVGVFFYAGHGVQVDGQNYLVPVGAQIEKERYVAIEAVGASWVLGQMEFAGNRMNFIILDACRNNPLTRGFRSATRGLSRMDAPRGSLVAYSTGPGKVARDGAGANSPFTAALARELAVPGVPVEQVFKQVRRSVMAATNEEQVPWESSSLTGDFYFNGAPSGEGQVAIVTPPPASSVAASKVAAEVAFWQSIEGSEDPADFRAYLGKYGDTGTFTVLARNRVRSLGDAASTRSTTQNDGGMSDAQLAAETLVNAKQMLLELTENAGAVMGSKDVPMIERIAKFRGMLGHVVDFEPMARFVLGHQYERATPAQWDNFFLLYKELFLTGYSFSKAKSWAGKYDIKEIRPYGKDTLVMVEFIDAKGETLTVGIRIRRKPDSFFGFKIIDAMTKGISLLVTQKEEFAPFLAKDGIDGLNRALEDRVGKVAKPIEIP